MWDPAWFRGGAIRRGRYKLIEWFEGSVAGEGVAFELFDLEADISETRNLRDSHPELAAELKAELRAWRERSGAQMPVPSD